MQNRTLQPVIIAGGSGTRLWPVSRQLYPKQFLPLTSANSCEGDGSTNETMLQKTVARLSSLDCHPPIIVCNEEHRFIASEQLREMDIKHAGLILESVGRNTAPAICLAALRAMEVDADAPLLILPADHHILDEQAFCESVNKASEQAFKGDLITFGIVPDRAATGYGYIKYVQQSASAPYAVEQFVEKPQKEIAEQYLSSGDYLWNSGIFMFTAKTVLNQMQQFRPDIASACEKAWSAKEQDLDFIRVDKDAFEACPSDSIDYAVMEKTDKAYVMPIDVGWSDVGSWSALQDVMQKDSNGNVQIGDVISRNTHNSYLHANDRLVAVLGLDDVIVVDTKDALLVAAKDQVENVKTIVEQIKADKRAEYIHHREVYRPWGKYDSMDSGERFQVKRITVKPGAKLSVQMHHHRAEHWVVVSGSAKVNVGGEDKLLCENQSVYIPIGTVHSLENPGKIPLELIEVQSGAYLGEDDIVRFEDRYGRS